jgi:hypothetical protein
MTVETSNGGAGSGGDYSEGFEKAGLADAARSMDMQHRQSRVEGIV